MSSIQDIFNNTKHILVAIKIIPPNILTVVFKQSTLFIATRTRLSFHIRPWRSESVKYRQLESVSRKL